MARVFVLPYRTGSNSARELAAALGVRRINLVRTRYRPRLSDIIINWGNKGQEYTHLRYINPIPSVKMASCKLATLRVLKERGVPTVEWTDSPLTAAEWCAAGSTIFARHTVTGQGGSGIQVVGPHDPTPRAPLYTRYFKARHEYRAHVVGGTVIDVQKKRRRNGADRALVRNLDNGYVYCRENVEAPLSVTEAAKAAIAALRLDFGAVDILCKENGTCAVLEVNTAPGLEGTTIEKYATAIRTMLLDRAVGNRS